MKQTQSVVKRADDRIMEFVPFGAKDKIKLSVGIVQNMVAVKTKSGKTCSETDAIKFMMLCQARKLNPFEGDAFLIGYENKEGVASFSLITAHQAFLKRAEIHPEYDGMKSGIIIKRGDAVVDLEGDFYLEGDVIMGGWATVFFKTRSHPMHKRIRLKRFQKSWGIWQEDPAGMICKCAEADALRSSFPTMLGGMYLKEEMDQQHPQETKMVKPIFGGTKDPQVVEVVASEKPEPEPAPPLDQVRQLMQVDKIEEATLMELLCAVGLAEDNQTLQDCSEDTLGMCLEQWSDFVRRIREVEGQIDQESK